jgi:hypothetical protein
VSQGGIGRTTLAMVSAFSPLTRCSSTEANLEGQPGWTKSMMDMSPPAFLGLLSGFRARDDPSPEAIVADADVDADILGDVGWLPTSPARSAPRDIRLKCRQDQEEYTRCKLRPMSRKRSGRPIDGVGAGVEAKASSGQSLSRGVE